MRYWLPWAAILGVKAIRRLARRSYGVLTYACRICARAILWRIAIRAQPKNRGMGRARAGVAC